MFALVPHETYNLEEERKDGAGEIAQSVKYLLGKYEDLISIYRNNVKTATKSWT